jgi:predicted flap endonuclease-1-like 5' DNA nuclease
MTGESWIIMRVNKWLLPTLALILMLGTVGVAQANGWWIVSGKEMVNVEQLTGGADVKGWMTLQQVADGVDIDTATLYAQLGLAADIPPETALKDLEKIVAGFEVSVVREVVDTVLGKAPAAATEPAPPAATPVATEAAATSAPTPTPQPTPAPTAEHTPLGAGSGAGTGEEGVPPAVTSALDIKGRHTLREIADATGIDLADLLTALELPADTDPGAAVRDLVEAGLVSEVGEIRAAVAALQQ